MKNLIYKEFKLAMHPLCYVLCFLLPIAVIAPNYPLLVTFSFIVSVYSILFLGASKGKQSNDLLFTSLLPVRKKDIIKARLITCTIILIAYLGLMAAWTPVARIIHDIINASKPGSWDWSKMISIPNFMAVCGFAFIGFGIFNLIFFAFYYRKGRSIVAATIVGGIFLILYFIVITLIVPSISPAFLNFFGEDKLLNQGIALGVGIIAYFLISLITYKVASSELEKIDQ